MNKIMLLLTAAISFFAFTSQAQRVGFADENWKTIKTEHFDIIFSAEQQDLGLYYADVAEKAFQNLQTIFTEKPSRTVLVVNDKTDASNGYATRIPYPFIMAYAVQINDHDSLSESGEWARELITHEMTHILQLEPALGFYKFLRPVFGTIVAPNLLLPLWWKEGMAVEMETLFSNRGRLRSLHQDAALRAMHLDKKLFSYTLESTNEILPSWPFGNRPYLFGSVFWNYLGKVKKKSAVDFLTQQHGRSFPYLINMPMQELNEESYTDVYNQSLLAVQDNAEQQIQILEKSATTDLTPVAINGQSAIQPIFSKRHQLLAFVENKDGDPELTIQKMDDTFVENLKKKPTGQLSSIIFHPSLPQIYYTKIDRINSKESFSDIFIYDIAADSVVRVTTGQRARDLRFSDDEKSLVFIATFNGKTQIKTIELATKKVATVVESNFNQRFYSPLFWDDSSVLFTVKDSSGNVTLQKIDLNTKAMTTVPLQLKNIGFLRKTNGKLYFTSSENGVFNIYVTSDLKTTAAVTHVKTGIWSFAVDEDSQKIWATTMTGEGFRITKFSLAKIKENLPVITNKLVEHYEPFTEKAMTAVLEVGDYKPGGYLWPQYWIPYIASTSSSEGIYVQAQTSGHDPVKIHQYSLLGNYQSDTKKAGFAGLYTNSSFTVPVQVGALQTNQTFGSVGQIVETQTQFVSLNPDMFRVNKYLSLQIGYQQQATSFVTATKHAGPFTQLIFLNYDQNIFQISPEEGAGAAVRYERQQNLQGSIDYNRVYATFLKFHSYGLPKHHALMLRLNGLITFEPLPARFGSSNSSAFLAADTLNPQFVLRGYTPNQFFGRSLWTVNTEYRFPVMNIERGAVSPAFFLKRLSGAIVADGLAVYKERPRSRLNESYWSAGLEAKLETSVGYILPLNLIVGAYYPFSPLFSDGPAFALALQLGGL